MANYVAPVTGTWAAKGSSPFMAARSGGHRYHAGNDLQAANGTPAVAAIGGTVQYAGHNQGYQWNAVVLGDDGNAYRYATHGPLSVKVGERVEAGQQVGTIARGHLHFEVIPPTSPAYKEMAAKPGQFVSTRYLPGGKASTIDPAQFFGVKGGAEIAAGQPVGAAPQAAQSAIASLVAPQGGSSVPDMPTAAMGYAPNLPGNQPPAPPMPQMASATPPMPSPPPQWAQANAFPIDEALSGRSAQDVLMGGPRSDPRRIAPGTGPIGPDMGSMLSPADVLAAGPRMRPGGAPDASAVPMPQASPFRPAMGGPNDRRPQPPMPPMRPGGAPDAASVPMPPPRAQGIPNPRPRGTPYAPTFPDLYGDQPPALAGGMSAEMGNAPPPPAPPQPSPPITQSDVATLGKAMDMGHDRQWFENPFNAGQLRPQSSPPPMPAEARTKDDAYTPQTGPFFDAADPSLSLPPSWSGASAFPAPPSPIGTVGAGSTGGENFTPAPPVPMPQPNLMTDRFNDAFSPPGGGQIMDLQAAFNRQNAPPTMNAQDGINSVFGAPPVQAMPPNLAIPFAEVPRPNFDFAGPAPAAAANIASPMPTPGISRADFDARFAGGTVAPSTPKPGVTPGVVAGEMPTPAAPAPPPPAPAPMPPVTPPTPPQRPPTQQQRQGIARLLGGLLGGPIGALGGGLLGGGGGGGGFGFGQPATFAWSGGGSAPYGNNGGSTSYKTGTSNALGGSNALSWQGSKGQTVTVVENPWSPGTYLTSY